MRRIVEANVCNKPTSQSAYSSCVRPALRAPVPVFRDTSTKGSAHFITFVSGLLCRLSTREFSNRSFTFLRIGASSLRSETGRRRPHGQSSAISSDHDELYCCGKENVRGGRNTGQSAILARRLVKTGPRVAARRVRRRTPLAGLDASFRAFCQGGLP